MLWCYGEFYFGIHYLHRDGIAYGDTYIANSDLQDGLMIENQAMLNAGFKTGDKIIAADGEKLPNLTMTST
jgi:hypothetical protein